MMKPNLIAKRIATMPRAGIRVIFDAAQKYPDAIHLEIGQPDFPTPPPICQAAWTAIQAGQTRYTANPGTLELRQDLVDSVFRTHSVNLTPEEIVVTTGGMGALATSFEAIIDPGDEILLPDPGWPNYGMQVVCAGGKPVAYNLNPADGFQPDFVDIAAKITERTKAILVNSPSNPTGSIISAKAVEQLLALTKQHDILLVADEVYDNIVFDGPFTSFLRQDARDRVLYINSFSKTYAMTGWRIGYLVAPAAIAREVAKLQEVYCACACSVSQAAARAALRLPTDKIQEMLASYTRRRDILSSIFDPAGVKYFRPQGTFFLLLDIAVTGLDSQDFALKLLHETQVAVAPGATFGANARQHVRLSFALQDEKLTEGARRIVKFLNNYRR